ncbi:DNA protecting protein DprA [Lactobacillus psittaci DSM 15354]|uniref:DNA protecting protein DprA n=2 Tax=Lactobacillus psittaci TaxID=116089 RepID=A0A0R1S508_9LACO|nr:DNA protecting protein DprA [Lactobacillus psittaci DSM 15354]
MYLINEGDFMKINEFILRMKLEKGLGYQKMWEILTILAFPKQVSQTDLLALPVNLSSLAQKAFSNIDHAKAIELIKAQCQIITIMDEIYPELLRESYHPPLILFAKGDLSLLKRRVTVIVGSRNPSKYSENAIRKLMPALKGHVIASGLAKGVDAMAHQAALAAGLKTIAVVGNGLNHFYPEQNHALQLKIIEKGLLLSEYLPDTPPRPFRFPERNRILAGLAENVIVTEALQKSGSLITANMALNENRNIYALPGPIFSPLSKGPNELIAAGAVPIVDFGQIKEDFQKLVFDI